MRRYLILLFFFSFLFVASVVEANTIIIDDFENWNTGYDLNGQGSWFCLPWDCVYSAVVSESTAESGIKSAYVPGGDDDNNTRSIASGNSLVAGTISFWFYSSATEGEYNYYDKTEIKLKESPAGEGITVYFMCNDGTNPAQCDLVHGYIWWRAPYGYNDVLIGSYPLNMWVNLQLEWDANVPQENTGSVKWNLGNSQWSAWSLSPNAFYTLGVFEMSGVNVSGSNLFVSFIDNIAATSSPPPPTCEEDCNYCPTWEDCLANDCYWFYYPSSDPLYLSTLGACIPSSEDLCDNTPTTCAYCNSSSTCNYVGCYWDNDYCRFGSTVCGQGMNLKYCLTQEDCEATSTNGYWYEGFCYLDQSVVEVQATGYFQSRFSSALLLLNHVPVNYLLVFIDWLNNLSIVPETNTTLSLDLSAITGTTTDIAAIDFNTLGGVPVNYEQGKPTKTWNDYFLMFSRLIPILMLVGFTRWWITWVFE